MSSFSHDLSGRVSFTIKSSLTRCWIFSRAQNRDSSPLTMKITGLLTGFLLALVLSIIICEGFNVISNPSLKYRTPVKLRRQKLRPSQILPSSNNNNEHYPFHHRELFLLASSSAAADGNDSSASSSSTEDSSSSESSPGEDRAASIATNKDLSLLQRLKKPFAKKEEDDGLTFRQRLAKMGLAAVLSYGMVSNISYSISVSLAWYIFSSRTGLSPLAKGQWKPFLAVYAGFFVFNNIIRPLRLAVSVAVSTQLDKLVEWMQERLRIKKALAYTLCVLVVNIFGTTALMCMGILLASLASGVPIFPKA